MKGVSQIKPFGLRMPAELRQWVSEQAAKNQRSSNSEIVARLLREMKEEVPTVHSA